MGLGYEKSVCQSAIHRNNKKIDQTMRGLKANMKEMEFKNAKKYEEMKDVIDAMLAELNRVRERLNGQGFE